VGREDGAAKGEAGLCYRSCMNCSASDGRLSRAARCVHIGSVILLATLCGPAQAQNSIELDDAAARLQYAFYTGDTRALEEVLKLIEGVEGDASLASARSYQLAYGNWKLAQLYAQPEDRAQADTQSLARKAAQRCAREAKVSLERDDNQAELYAIEAACADFAPGAPGGGSPGCARSKAMRQAVTLAKDNPRVQFVQALCQDGKAPDPAMTDRWRAVVATFEAAPPSRPGQPDWGHVEALTLLGQSYLQRGDPVAARDALERALVLAPDYRHAQRLLQTAAIRPR
jgi:tetratricopeptide (TPR) repeat protein